MTKFRWATIALTIIVLAFSAFAITIPPPIPNTKVQDHAGVLTDLEKSQLQSQLQEFKDKYNLEVGVAFVTTTGGYDTSEYANEMARQYGIGAKDGEQRGLLVLIVTKDRKWFVATSRHMEGVLTDVDVTSLGRQLLVPQLKQGQWNDGVTVYLAAINTRVQTNITAEQQSATPTDVGWGWWAWSALVGLFVGLGMLVWLWMRRLFATTDNPITPTPTPANPYGGSMSFVGSDPDRKWRERRTSSTVRSTAHRTEESTPRREEATYIPTYDPSPSYSSSESSSSSSPDSTGFSGGGDFSGGGGGGDF